MKNCVIGSGAAAAPDGSAETNGAFGLLHWMYFRGSSVSFQRQFHGKGNEGVRTRPERPETASAGKVGPPHPVFNRELPVVSVPSPPGPMELHPATPPSVIAA